jgi:YVTN family beta-propeller protein
MRALRAAALLLPLVTGCHLRAPGGRSLGPLEGEGEVYVYLQPAGGEAGGISFSIRSAAAARLDGAEAALEAVATDLAGEGEVPRQRLLAWGRLPPGEYPALVLGMGRARLAGTDGDLLVAQEPVRIEVPMGIRAGHALVVHLALRPTGPPAPGAAFQPDLEASIPPGPVPDMAVYCTNSGAADVSVLDRRRHEAMAVIPTGSGPEGIAVDTRRARAYVALSGEDAVDVLDLASGESLRRLPLRGGDRPREVALSPDGSLLLIANQGSNSVVFADPSGPVELSRVPVAEEPWSLLVDRSGKRAYLTSRRAATLTVLDLASRSVAATTATDAEPVRAQLDRAGTRLYVIHASSAYMTVLDLPALTVAKRVHVGFGASALKVDARTDLLYVGLRDDDRIQVYDPLALVPLDFIQLPGPVSYLAIDDAENALVGLVPGKRTVAFVDLTRRRILGLADVGTGPRVIAAAGERN